MIKEGRLEEETKVEMKDEKKTKNSEVRERRKE